MKEFTHINATTVDDAVSALAEHGDKAMVLAGGTDLLGELVDRVMPYQPEYIINLKTISGLASIQEDSAGLKIGALTPLDDIVNSSVVQSNYSVLAQAARKVASWQIRNMGTIGGNICQQVRCLYYRTSWNPSDTAPALIALDAQIVTSQRTINAEDFFDGFSNTVLNDDEIVKEISIPTPPSGSKQAFVKASIRRAVDFALASCAVVIAPATGSITSARVALGSVGTTPIRASGAEDALMGNSISESVAETAAAAAVDNAFALPLNKYKIETTKGVIKQAILS
jgi:xanthine dehydrogenase YagS FAD-binding subunit